MINKYIILRKGLICAFLIVIFWCTILNAPTFRKTPAPTIWKRNNNLTIDPLAARTIKDSLNKEMLHTFSIRSVGILLNADTGEILASTSLVNPRYSSPAVFGETVNKNQDYAVTPWEPGSVMKPLLIAAALNEKTITLTSKYYEPGFTYVGERRYENAESFPPSIITPQDILNKSLNTGAIHVLRTLGGGDINKQAMATWYDYLTRRFQFNKSYDTVRQPSGGQDLEKQYASSAFGVGITISPIQLTSAYAAIVNGGTYYKPHITVSNPVIVRRNIVSKSVSQTMVNMLHVTLVNNEPEALKSGYIVGAKTGTAPLAGRDSAYINGYDSGTYIGYLGKSSPHYILLIRFDGPHTNGFASAPAKVLWAQLSKQLNLY